MSGRQVHRLVGHGSHRTVQLALGRLAGEGLLSVQEYGPSKLYSLNRDHLAAEPVLALLGIRRRLLERLRSTFANWPVGPAHAFLFGSAARGDGDEESDIDLLIVRRAQIDAEDQEWRSQIEDLGDAVRRWTGNRAAVSELSESELRELLAIDPPIVAELRAEAIALSGPRFGEYVRAPA